MEPLGLVGNGLKDATDTVKATWWASVMERLQLTCGQLETLWSACEEEAGRQAPWDSDAQRAWGSSNFVASFAMCGVLLRLSWTLSMRCARFVKGGS